MSAALGAIAIVLALILAAGAGAARARTHGSVHHGSVHVRHERIHREPRKDRKHAHKHHAVHKHGKGKDKGKTNKRHSRKGHGLPATASRDCPGANLTPEAGDIENVVAATLCLINDERARFGAPALIEDPRLTGTASEHSRDMDAHDYFEHTSPSGQTLLDRIQASGFIPNGDVGYTLGENIAWGTMWLGTPRTIVKAWMESPGHRANILDGAFRYTGIGVDPDLPQSMSDGQAGGMYTQDFGTIISN
jgi:uncharacterized protein YkwD